MIRLCLLVSFTLSLAAEPVHYRVGFERPNTHLMDVTIRIPDLNGQTLEVAIPDWSPGAYSIRNFAENVQRFRAADDSSRELAWRKTDSQTWRIDLAGAKTAVVSYQVFDPQYNDRHATINGPASWMYVVGGKNRAADLAIDRAALPVEWKIATGMKRTSDTTFAAEDYDWFADCPIEISDYGEQVFEALGTTYHIVVDPKEDRDFPKFAADLKKVIETLVTMMAPAVGGNRAAPFADYWFLMHITGGRGVGGGVEHLNSTMITYSDGWSDHSATTADDLTDVYTAKLFVAAHEFFHAWNVKRLRPRELGPFDYTQMVHTPSLWISEGITSYYAGLALERAGFLTPQQYLDYLARVWTALEANPGRKERSVADTSWDTWFGGASGGGGRGGNVLANNLANTNYSYYDGGQTLGSLLDMEIRHATGDRKSLDDWMRLMYSRYALPKPGFTPEEAVRAASEVAGTDMSGFFSKYVTGKDPLPYERDFGYAGVEVTSAAHTQPWLGATLAADSAGRATVSNMVPGGPAEAGGLDRGDTILAIDGKVVDRAAFEKAIAAGHAGEPVALTVNHLGRVAPLAVKLSTDPSPQYRMKPSANPDERQRAIYRGYLNVP